MQEPPKGNLHELIRLVLTKNSFISNKTNYLQIHITAMGTRMAPSYYNLFIGKLERELMQTLNKIPRVWWRYTTDIFTICDLGEPSPRLFIENLNRHYLTIKFTTLWSTEEVTFLNMRLRRRNWGGGGGGGALGACVPTGLWKGGTRGPQSSRIALRKTRPRFALSTSL